MCPAIMSASRSATSWRTVWPTPQSYWTAKRQTARKNPGTFSYWTMQVCILSSSFFGRNFTIGHFWRTAHLLINGPSFVSRNHSAFHEFCIDWLIDWFADWLIDWLNVCQVSVDWLIDWLVEFSWGVFVYRSIDWLIRNLETYNWNWYFLIQLPLRNSTYIITKLRARAPPVLRRTISLHRSSTWTLSRPTRFSATPAVWIFWRMPGPNPVCTTQNWLDSHSSKTLTPLPGRPHCHRSSHARPDRWGRPRRAERRSECRILCKATPRPRTWSRRCSRSRTPSNANSSRPAPSTGCSRIRRLLLCRNRCVWYSFIHWKVFNQFEAISFWFFLEYSNLVASTFLSG